MNTELAISLLKIFKNDAAKRIIEVLRQNPGANQIDVMVKLRNMNQPNLSQRLSELIRLNIVHCKRKGKNKHYSLMKSRLR
jgi:DNA-binding transcriptional ArsR family regulator